MDDAKIKDIGISSAKIMDIGIPENYTPANYYARPEGGGEMKITTGTLPAQPRHVVRSIDKFKEVINTQSDKGIEKYGQPLQPIAIEYDWLEMAAEEMVDGFQYLVAEMEKRKFVAKKIRSLTQDAPDDIKGEIGHWLDVLEGI